MVKVVWVLPSVRGICKCWTVNVLDCLVNIMDHLPITQLLKWLCYSVWMGNVSAELITVQSKSLHNNPLKFSHCLKEKFSFCQVFLESVVFCLWRGKNHCIELSRNVLLSPPCICVCPIDSPTSYNHTWLDCDHHARAECILFANTVYFVHTQCALFTNKSLTRNMLISLYCYWLAFPPKKPFIRSTNI